MDMDCGNGEFILNKCICDKGWFQPIDFVFKSEEEKDLLPCVLSKPLFALGFIVNMLIAVITLFLATFRARKLRHFKRLLPAVVSLCCLIGFSITKLINIETPVGIDPVSTLLYVLPLTFSSLMLMVIMSKNIYLHEKLMFGAENAVKRQKYGTKLRILIGISTSFSPISFSLFATTLFISNEDTKILKILIFIALSICAFQVLLTIGYTIKLYSSLVSELKSKSREIDLIPNEYQIKIAKRIETQKNGVIILILIGGFYTILIPILSEFNQRGTNIVSLLLPLTINVTITTVVITNLLNISTKQKTYFKVVSNHKKISKRKQKQKQKQIQKDKEISILTKEEEEEEV